MLVVDNTNRHSAPSQAPNNAKALVIAPQYDCAYRIAGAADSRLERR
jgi:hypothetical protein